MRSAFFYILCFIVISCIFSRFLDGAFVIYDLSKGLFEIVNVPLTNVLVNISIVLEILLI